MAFNKIEFDFSDINDTYLDPKYKFTITCAFTANDDLQSPPLQLISWEPRRWVFRNPLSNNICIVRQLPNGEYKCFFLHDEYMVLGISFEYNSGGTRKRRRRRKKKNLHRK
jgi:hypothetical protein